MNTPTDYKFMRTHEWIAIEGNKAKIGISDYAQDALGDIVFISLPEIGDEVAIGESFSDIESVKAVSEAYSPVNGVVINVNSALEDAPESLNSDPYNSWLIEVEFSELDDLLTWEEYDQLDKE